jgi:hypothetical protein
MFATAFSTVSGLFDGRFLRTALLPCLLLATALFTVWEATGEGLTRAAERLADLDGTEKLILAILVSSGLVLAGVLLASLSSTLITWWEGSRGPLKRVAPWGKAGQHWFKRKQKTAQIDAPDFDVPRQGKLAPTALGTLGYANAEHVQRCYGIDLAYVWPKLYATLPADARAPIDASAASLEQHLALATLGIVFAGAADVAAAWHRAPVALCVALALGGFGFALLLYRSSLGPATVWSDQVRAAVDLYRHTLLEQLNIPRPATVAEERDLWPRLSALLTAQDMVTALAFTPEGS